MAANVPPSLAACRPAHESTGAQRPQLGSAGRVPLIGSGQRRGAAARGASFGLVTSTVSVSPLDWAARRVAEAGRVLAAGGCLVLVDLHAIGYLRVLCTLARRPGCDVRFPDLARAWNPASGGGSGHE